MQYTGYMSQKCMLETHITLLIGYPKAFNKNKKLKKYICSLEKTIPINKIKEKKRIQFDFLKLDYKNVSGKEWFLVPHDQPPLPTGAKGLQKHQAAPEFKVALRTTSPAPPTHHPALA